MRNRLSGVFLAIATLALPMAALADLTGTVTLPSGTALSLDTGATSSSGGDILFTGNAVTSQITPQGNATAFVASNVTVDQFNATTLMEVQSSSSAFSNKPINGATLPVGEMFWVYTNGSNYAKVLVTAVNTGSITLMYDTFGAGGTSSGPPTITAVLDAGSYTPNIAEGSVFVVKGTGLSSPGLTEPPFPLPTSVGGVSITFSPSTGANGIQAYIDYLYNESGVNQLAAILPSNLPVGFYDVTVANNGVVSSPFPVSVVEQKPGLLTVDESGDGLAVAQNYISATELDLDRYTTGTVGGFTTSPAYPGETLIAWATGLGPVGGGDNIASAGYNFDASGGNVVQVIVGGISITPTYAGRAPGLAGADQIDFTLPANVTTGCVVPIQISENGILSKPTYLSIATPGATACVEPGYTTSQLQSFDNGGTVDLGSFSILQENESANGQAFTLTSALGHLTQFSGFELAGIVQSVSSNVATPGPCTVIQITPGTVPAILPSTSTNLDAGRITLSGPSGSNLTNAGLAENSGIYQLAINGQGSGMNGNIVPGTYTLNAEGGTGVGPFSATLILGAPLTLAAALPSTVTRSQGLTINWTGGNTSDVVTVAGTATTITNDFQTGATFVCVTTAGAGGITVPPSILNQLPAVTAAQIANLSGNGTLSVNTGSTPSNGNGLFTAPLVAGGSIANATFIRAVEIGVTPAYQ
jgi:uncharacterized protein (TIGR03437 family)